jgi:dephospho-CoA kinase
MKTIGLVGGVASGKSAVAKILVELGAGLLDADRAGHDVLAHDPAVRSALVNRWGSSILAANDSIDRAAVAGRVFGQDDVAATDRHFLESLLHPRIAEVLAEKKAEFAAAGRSAVVLDAPLLLEADWQPLCDVVVFVDTDRDIRLARVGSRGWTPDEFARREAAQWPVKRKHAAADVVLANSGDVDTLRQGVRDIWRKYVAG